MKSSFVCTVTRQPYPLAGSGELPEESRQESSRDSLRVSRRDFWRDSWRDFSRSPSVSPIVSDWIICMTLGKTLSEPRYFMGEYTNQFRENHFSRILNFVTVLNIE